MSIDYTNHTYIKIGNYSNVVNRISNHLMRDDGKSYIPAPLDELIDKLALRHPEWILMGDDSWHNGPKGFKINRFNIHEGDDIIGNIVLDTWSEPKFLIANKRIDKDLQRRNHKTTKDVDKAVKIIEKYFSSKTLNERISEGRALTSRTVTVKAWDATRAFDTVFAKLIPALTTYVVLNMGSIRHILESYGAPADALDMLSERDEVRKVTSSISNACTAHTGTTVLTHGDRYILLRGTDDTSTILTASQLDEDTRTKLGVLKVVGDGELIESIGARVNATTFYLLP